MINLNGTGIYNYGTMIIRGCTISSSGGTGIYSNGVHIEIYETLIGENSLRGMTPYNSSSNSRVQNCHILDNGSYGIEGYRFEVMNTTFTNNGDYAVRGGLYTIEESLFTESMMGIYGSNITVFNNVFEGQFYTSWFDTRFSGVCINGDVQISHNVFSGYQTGICVRTSTEVSISIQNNLITENYRGIYFENVDAQNLICSDNNIYGNLYWNVYNDTNQRIAIADSFWGNNDENVIKSKIFDYFRDSSKGPVSYTGFKSALVDGATSSKRIAVIPYNRQAVGFVDEVTIEWTAHDPDGLLESYDLYFGDTEPPEIYTEDAVSPVIVPVDHIKTYYSNVKGFNSQIALKTESNVLELYTGLTRVFGESSNDYGYSVVETSDGGLVMAGYTSFFGNGWQVYLLKTDSMGNLLWEKNFGGSSDDYGRSVVEASDGGLVVTGSKYYDQVYLLKTDSTGNLLWEKNFGGSEDEEGYSVVETTDSGLVVTGYTYSFGNGYQVYLLKTDSGGNLLWEKNFGGSSEDNGYSIVETASGGLVVVGRTSSYENSYQVYMIWTDSEGNGISEPGW